MKFTRRRRTYRLLGFIVFAGGLYISFQIFSMKLLSHESEDTKKRYDKILDSIQLDLIDESKPNKRGNHGNMDRDSINVNTVENEKLILQNKNAYHNQLKIDDNVNKLEFKRTNNIYDKKIIRENVGEKVDRLRDNDLYIKKKLVERFEQTVLVVNEDHVLPVVRKLKTEYPRGVPESLALLYLPNKDGQFICLHTKTVMLFSRVNDDFCDCEDSSDEPGTGACPNSRFYCAYQLDKTKLVFLPSSRVNDGICDCCDGSDEWNGNTVPSFIAGKKSSQGLMHSPCENTCMNLEEQNKADVRLRRMGEQLKEAYLQEGAAIEDPNKLYGLHGEFYKLSKDCYSYKTVEYNYHVCPFESAKQNSKIIGRSASWETQRDGKRVLRMSNGDAYGCAGRDRESVIEFVCGLHDQVMSVTEDERCLYSIRFLTPAAC